MRLMTVQGPSSGVTAVGRRCRKESPRQDLQYRRLRKTVLATGRCLRPPTT